MPGVSEFAREIEVSDEIMLSRLKENYDGYHFSKNCPDIYNPFSLLNALDSRNIGNYWFESGTPRYLLSVLKCDNFFLPELDCLEASQSDLSAEEYYMQNPVALLYESGYVTIKEYDDAITFTLGMPNREVATSFAKALSLYTDDAMYQIEDRGYTLPYADEARTIVRIAANYSTRHNNIDSWIVM